jgi:tryptophan 2,3-dioxygenase
MADERLTYQAYLKLEELFSLQRPFTDSQGELLFITVHQCIELLWRVALIVNDDVIRALKNENLVVAVDGIRRATKTLQTSTSVAKLLTVITPCEFAEFRAKLGTASGLQSNQFRELEIQAGLSGKNFLKSYAADSPEYKSVQARLDGTSLRVAFVSVLERHGLECSSSNILQAITRIYKEKRFRNLAKIADGLHAYDDAFGSFRWEHLQIVQRIIGEAVGTAGTSNYLQQQLVRRFFPELINFRTEIFD